MGFGEVLVFGEGRGGYGRRKGEEESIRKGSRGDEGTTQLLGVKRGWG